MKERKILLNSQSIDLSMFDGDKKLKKEIKSILKFVGKYSSLNIKKLMQLHSKDELLNDIIHLSAHNVFLSSLAGEHRGIQSIQKAERDISLQATFSKRQRILKEKGEKYTDKSLNSQSMIINKNYIMKEAVSDAQANVLGSLMFSVRHLCDNLKFAIDCLRREGKDEAD